MSRTCSLLWSLWREKRWANDIDAFALEAQPDRSQGRPPNKARARSPSSKPARPPCVLPGSPHPGRPTLRPAPDVSLRGDLHVPTSERLGCRRADARSARNASLTETSVALGTRRAAPPVAGSQEAREAPSPARGV